MMPSSAAVTVPPRPSRQPRLGRSPAARWLLLAAVIAGILAMHILGGHDSTGVARPAAMTPTAMTSAAQSMPGMDMSLAAPDPASPSRAAATAERLSAAVPGVSMLDMSCCVLFLSAIAMSLWLLRLIGAERNAGKRAPAPIASAGWATRTGAPPGVGWPRITLGVLRV